MLRYLLSACALLVVACGGGSESPSGEGPAASATAPPGATLRGVTLSPRSFVEPDFSAFFDQAKQAGEVVGWYGDWAQLADPKAAPAVVAELAKRYDYEPLFIANVFRASDGALNRPLDAANLAMYKQAAADFAKKYRPAYMGFGNEINVLYEKAPAAFETFVALFAETYDAVKAASPETKVFTVFQLERMKGLQGGLFGGRNDAALAQWQLVGRFAKADLIAFTTYPGIVFKDPAELPADYYAELSSRVGKPVAFTEVGWPSQMGVAGWETSEAEQAAFVARFLELSAAAKPALSIWAFLYDPASFGDPFRGIGLMRADGSPRPSFEAWRATR